MFRYLLLTGLMMTLTATNPGGGPPAGDSPCDRMLAAVAADVSRNPQVLGRTELSAPVLAAMAAVPREEFVPPELRPNAYANRPLPIGHGQTISQPTIVAMMTDLLEPRPDDVMLEVGTGSGYQAAVLAEILTRGELHTIEIVPELARTARERLQRLGYSNVRVHQGDGYRGHPDAAPFDGIIVTAAADDIPPPLLEQLKPGAVLVMPVGAQGDTQWLTVVRKDASGAIERQVVLPVRFVPLTRDAGK